MKRGYTEAEAQALVGCVFETQAVFSRVPRHSRGRVVEALDAGDHWNLLIEWELPGTPSLGWFDRAEVENSMRRVEE